MQVALSQRMEKVLGPLLNIRKLMRAIQEALDRKARSIAVRDVNGRDFFRVIWRSGSPADLINRLWKLRSAGTGRQIEVKWGLGIKIFGTNAQKRFCSVQHD